MVFRWTEVYGIFQDYKHGLFRKDGTIAGLATDDGFETYTFIAEAVSNYRLWEGGDCVSPKAVYLAFKYHWKFIFPDMYAQVCLPASDDLDELDELDDYEKDPMFGSDKPPSGEMWVDVDEGFLKPISAYQGRRSRQRLAPGWSAVLSKIICKAVHAKECVFTFREHDILMEVFLTTARCTDCGAEVRVNGKIFDSKLFLQFFEGTDAHHSRKRKIFGDERENIIKKAKNQSSINVLNEIIESEFEPTEDINSNVLPTQKKITQARYEGVKRELLHSDVFEALDMFNANSDTRFRGSIKLVGRRPFTVIFWLPIQKELYGILHRKNRMSIFIDATGTIVKGPLKEIDGSNSTVYLYNVVAKVEGFKSFPVGHIITNKHTSFHISYCLGLWAEDFKKPAEIVIDFSPALIISCIATFTEFKTRKQYLEACFKYLSKKVSYLPQTFIRIDVAHFISILHRNKYFLKLDPRSRRFFLNSFGLLMKSRSFETASEIMISILSIASSPFENDGSTIKLKKEFLFNAIVSHDIEKNLDAEPKGLMDYPEDELLQFEILSEIYDNVEICDSGTDNLYYAPNCINEFKRLFQTLPMWSAVLIDAFESPVELGTSAAVECSFNVVKNHIFEGKTNLRADYFIQKYCSSLSASLRILKSTEKIEDNDSDEDGDYESDCIDSVAEYRNESKILEDWRGKASRAEKKLRRSQTSILEQQNLPSGPTKNADIPFMTNGAKTNHGKRIIITTNTCAFDAICQIFLIFLIDFKIDDGLNESIHNFLICLSSAGWKIKAKQSRNLILHDLFRENIQEHNFIEQISCATNACHLISKIRTTPSVTMEFKCCVNKELQFKFLPVGIDVFDEDESLGGISKFIQFSERSCETCSNLVIPEVKLSDIVLIDCQKKRSFGYI